MGFSRLMDTRCNSGRDWDFSGRSISERVQQWVRPFLVIVMELMDRGNHKETCSCYSFSVFSTWYYPHFSFHLRSPYVEFIG